MGRFFGVPCRAGCVGGPRGGWDPKGSLISSQDAERTAFPPLCGTSVEVKKPRSPCGRLGLPGAVWGRPALDGDSCWSSRLPPPPPRQHWLRSGLSRVCLPPHRPRHHNLGNVSNLPVPVSRCLGALGLRCAGLVWFLGPSVPSVWR